MTYRYRVYVIDLRKDVLKEAKFRKRNPHYIPGKPCVYVGSTGKTVEERFKEHRDGVPQRHNKLAHRYGRRLRLNDMKQYRPRKSRAAIEAKECEVAESLQAKGWAVWWN